MIFKNLTFCFFFFCFEIYQDLIKEGPWEDETDDNEMEEEDCMMEEQDYTPSFNEWVT